MTLIFELWGINLTSDNVICRVAKLDLGVKFEQTDEVEQDASNWDYIILI